MHSAKLHLTKIAMHCVTFLHPSHARPSFDGVQGSTRSARFQRAHFGVMVRAHIFEQAQNKADQVGKNVAQAVQPNPQDHPRVNV